MGRLGWGFGRISGSFGGSFLVILDSRSVMTPNLDSGIMSSLDKALKASFLDLFSLPHCKDASVADLLEVSSNSLQWNVNFFKMAHDWKVDSFTSNLLYSSY